MSFDLVIVGCTGYAVLLIVLCFEDYLYIRITGTGVCFIGRSVSCPHICFFLWETLLKVGSCISWVCASMVVDGVSRLSVSTVLHPFR